jgi:hypothetical protein
MRGCGMRRTGIFGQSQGKPLDQLRVAQHAIVIRKEIRGLERGSGRLLPGNEKPRDAEGDIAI